MGKRVNDKAAESERVVMVTTRMTQSQRAQLKTEAHRKELSLQELCMERLFPNAFINLIDQAMDAAAGKENNLKDILDPDRDEWGHVKSAN